MNVNKSIQRKGAGLLLSLLLVFFTASSFAVDLAAVPRTWYPPDGGAPVPMWGFIQDPGSCLVPSSGNVWQPGVIQRARVNSTLTINLRNCLANGEKISLIIPGQRAVLTPQTIVDGQSRARVTSFTHEVAAPRNSVATYTWTNLKKGTYLYQSGSNPAKHMQMGLFGALIVGRENEASYDIPLIFSEIDPALHVTAMAATPLNYKPKYYLINGKSALPDLMPPNIGIGRIPRTLQLRFLNAGLMTHIPTIDGEYFKIVAEDGNTYPYPKEQYSVLLPAGKTIDAIWTADTIKAYKLYDRRLSMTTNGASGGGMVSNLKARPAFFWPSMLPAIIGGAK